MTDLRDQPTDPYAAIRAELLDMLELDDMLDDWAIPDPSTDTKENE